LGGGRLPPSPYLIFIKFFVIIFIEKNSERKIVMKYLENINFLISLRDNVAGVAYYDDTGQFVNCIMLPDYLFKNSEAMTKIREIIDNAKK
jgi:hypothetical protein